MATTPRQRESRLADEARRGLPSIHKARETRNKRVRPPLRAVVWFGIVLAVALSLYWFRSSSNVEKDRAALMADQRAVEAELGKKWYPLRDATEAMTQALAAAPAQDVVEKEELAKFAFQEKPGIYLRMRTDDAKTPESIRAAAKGSMRDGFTSCLMKTAGEDPIAGASCTAARDCASGQICNDMGHCAAPTQPYNLRLAYRTLYVLGPDWVKDVQDAADDMRIKVLRLGFDDATKSDLPVAVDLVTKATFFLAVLDDKPASKPAPAPQPTSSGGGDEAPSPEDLDVIGGAVYPSHIGLFRLEDKKLLLRITREPPATALLGGLPAKDPKNEAARLRQAQSCWLALEVRRAIGDATVAPK